MNVHKEHHVLEAAILLGFALLWGIFVLAFRALG